MATHPQRLGNYELLRPLAEGGMGQVFLARQIGPAGFSRPVAVKQILPHLATDRTFVELFLNEARVAAQVNHPNVVQIFELGRAGESYFIAMEFVHGVSLRMLEKTLRKEGRRLPLSLIASIVQQVLHGLHAAHTLVGLDGKPMPVIHRDVSPDNVLVGFNGTVKLTDFGVAKALTPASERSGVARGKFGYMSPEQLDGERTDARSDLFAVAIILYELMTGEHPFPADNIGARVKAITTKVPAPPSGSGVPAHVSEIVMQGLSKTPDGRFRSAAEMAEPRSTARFGRRDTSRTRSSCRRSWAGCSAPVL
jgi:serine/threonine-protein kinase